MCFNNKKAFLVESSGLLSPKWAGMCSEDAYCARWGRHDTMKVTVLHHRSTVTGWSSSRWLRLLVGTYCGHPLKEQHTRGLETAFTGHVSPELNRASGDGASWTCPSKRTSSGSVLVPEKTGRTFYFKNKYLQNQLCCPTSFFLMSEI